MLLLAARGFRQPYPVCSTIPLDLPGHRCIVPHLIWGALMARMLVGATLAFMAVSALGGCGTVENIVSMGPAGEDHLRVYGGVRRDLEVAHDCAVHPENQ